MIKLSEDLKQMLTGLAYQDAGDFLSIREKMKVLGDDPENHKEMMTPSLGFEPRQIVKSIALVSDGRGLEAPLDYAIDACQRKNAKIDLLVHGTSNAENTSAIERKIQNSGVSYQRIQLEATALNSIIEYIVKHPSLLYLIAMPYDEVARAII
jgi:hypothetical protein